MIQLVANMRRLAAVTAAFAMLSGLPPALARAQGDAKPVEPVPLPAAADSMAPPAQNGKKAEKPGKAPKLTKAEKAAQAQAKKEAKAKARAEKAAQAQAEKAAKAEASAGKAARAPKLSKAEKAAQAQAEKAAKAEASAGKASKAPKLSKEEEAAQAQAAKEANAEAGAGKTAEAPKLSKAEKAAQAQAAKEAKAEARAGKAAKAPKLSKAEKAAQAQAKKEAKAKARAEKAAQAKTGKAAKGKPEEVAAAPGEAAGKPAKAPRPPKVAKARAPEKSMEEQRKEDGIYAKRSNWLSLRFGYAKRSGDLAGDGFVGYGVGFQHMITRKYAFAVGAGHDVVGHFQSQLDEAIPFTGEFQRHFKWDTAVRPYVGLGGGYYLRKSYRTGGEYNTTSSGGAHVSLGFTSGLDPKHVIGLEARMARLKGRPGVVNPTFGPGEELETIWTAKLIWGLVY